MAKDPAFLFYPGDYLRDTQCLSEASQASYDRIMCEHMRNICISQQQLNFFTKRLNSEQKEELVSVLTKVPGGFQIDWVVDSILKRRAYSESRSKNRKKNKTENKDTYDKHMKTYEHHMEIENEIESKDGVDNNKNVFKKNPLPENCGILPEIKINSVIQLFRITKGMSVNADQVLGLWNIFKIQNLDGVKFYNNESDVHSHFINWSKGQKIENLKNVANGSETTTAATKRTGRNAGLYNAIDGLKNEWASNGSGAKDDLP